MGKNSTYISRRLLLFTMASFPALSAPLFSISAQAQTAPGDPLPSWNEGAAKAAIISLVKSTTDAASPNYRVRTGAPCSAASRPCPRGASSDVICAPGRCHGRASDTSSGSTTAQS